MEASNTTGQATTTSTEQEGFSNAPGRGALFQNDKGGVDTRPDYRGRMTTRAVTCPHCEKEVPAEEVRISGWRKKSQGGRVYLSLAFGDKPAAKPDEGNGGL